MVEMNELNEIKEEFKEESLASDSLDTEDIEERANPPVNGKNSRHQLSKFAVHNSEDVKIENLGKANDKAKEEEIQEKPASHEDDIIRLVNVHKTYLIGVEGVAALRGVTLNIKRGEFVCIQGTSGGGKTTLLNIIGTIDKPTKGDLYLCGTRIKNSTPDKTLASIRLNRVAFVFQTFNLISSLTALENVELPMQLKGEISRSKIRERARELLRTVGLADRVEHFPKQLSGGEQQRVTIARAISNKPSILLLDEPTGDLDTYNTDVVMDILLNLNINEKITMVMVTHDVALKNYANRVVRMIDGCVAQQEVIAATTRGNYQKALKKRIEIGQSGGIGSVNVREGIYTKMEMNPTDNDPSVVHVQQKRQIETQFTSVRDPRDYPVLLRFNKNR